MTIRMSRRAVLAAAAGSAISVPFTRIPGRAQEEDVEHLLRIASDRMAGLASFHFEMKTIDGKATVLDNLELKSVVGDVVRPDSFRAAMTAGFAMIDVTVEVVSIGGKVWITDPLNAGQWQQVADGTETGAAAAFTDLVNPDQLFLLAVEYIEEPTIEGTEELYGEECTVITGTFVPSRLQELASPVAEEGPLPGAGSLLSTEPVFLTAWVAGDGRIFRLEEAGPLTPSESHDVVRQIDFTNFDADIQIAEPSPAA